MLQVKLINTHFMLVGNGRFIILSR